MVEVIHFSCVIVIEQEIDRNGNGWSFILSELLDSDYLYKMWVR